MKIINDILINKEAPILITGLHTDITVTVQYPKDSVLLCYIDGYTPLTYFPLVWNGECCDDGLVFRGKLLFNRSMIEFVNKSIDESYLKFKIFSTEIEGKQKFTINYTSIDRLINALPNTYLQLVNTVNSLSTRLDSYIRGDYFNNTMKFVTDNSVKKGMSPVTIDNEGNYVWDYPYMKEKQILKDTAELLKDINNQVITLTNRVNALEDKLIKHIYVEYE